MFGIDLKGELTKLLASPEVRRLLSWLQSKLDRITDTLAAQERMLAYDHGLPVRDVPPHDPRRLPFVHRAEQATNVQLNIAPALGKPVTRGHVINYGTAKALLVFIRTSNGREERVEYLLPNGAALDFSWFFDALEIKDAGEGPVDVQVLAQ